MTNIYDPRSFSIPVHGHLSKLKSKTTADKILKEQKNQAVELYTYLASWGLMRLKAEELIQKGGKQEIIVCFLEVLQEVAGLDSLTIDSLKKKSSSEYLGLTGLALTLAREFAFWSKAIYSDVEGGS
jgi:hypothetical protein